MFRLTYQHTLPITYSWDLIIMLRLTYQHTLPITYYWDVIIMFRLTYSRTACTLPTHSASIDLHTLLYLIDIIEIRTYRFYSLFLGSYHVHTFLHTLSIAYSWYLIIMFIPTYPRTVSNLLLGNIIMFRLSYPRTVYDLLLGSYYHVHTNLHTHCL